MGSVKLFPEVFKNSHSSKVRKKIKAILREKLPRNFCH
jgi:hypothetical protein